jgi:xanthine/CO dehydrogenase XdhC/CoxF family maturation factor
MAEFDRIFETIDEWAARGQDFALATVVGVRGSTYRGLAARQLVAADGTSVGTVSGGCLDSDLRAVAADVMADGRARLVEFDLTADDEAIWGWGIGCNGATKLLVEPAGMAAEISERLAELRAAQRPAAVVHMLSDADAVGSRAVVTHTSVDGSIPGALVDEAREALVASRHRLVDTGEIEALIEVVASPSRLVVCGAGHDAVPVVRLGADLGFEVIVVDDRRQFLADERFPEAAGLVHCEPLELATAVELDRRAHVLLMSHNYLRDLDYLRAACSAAPAYIGVLGPGERLERLLDDLDSAGLDSVPEDILYGPAGLDIGAEGPVEIAWSILSEILAVRRSKSGGSLRDRKGPKSLRR